jgi:putative transposase
MKKFVRKINRLQVPEIYNGGYWYFITICASDKICIFELNNSDIFSKLVIKEWLDILSLYNGVTLDEFVLMPNHFHAIIGLNNPKHLELNKIETLGSIISRFKNSSRNAIVSYMEVGRASHGEKLGIIKSQFINTFPNNFNYHKLWQRSYYDHIIRNESELHNIRKYIIENPILWVNDELNPGKMMSNKD